MFECVNFCHHGSRAVRAGLVLFQAGSRTRQHNLAIYDRVWLWRQTVCCAWGGLILIPLFIAFLFFYAIRTAAGWAFNLHHKFHWFASGRCDLIVSSPNKLGQLNNNYM